MLSLSGIIGTVFVMMSEVLDWSISLDIIDVSRNSSRNYLTNEKARKSHCDQSEMESDTSGDAGGHTTTSNVPVSLLENRKVWHYLEKLDIVCEEILVLKK